MATQLRETDSYSMYKGDDGKIYAMLKGGIATGTAGHDTEMEALESLLIYQRDLVNQRNKELNAIRRALPQNWLSDLWKDPSPIVDKANSDVSTTS